MSDISRQIKSDKDFLKIMWKALMEFGTMYDGKERITEILLGTLATGDCQQALQLGSIYKGSYHEAPADCIKGPWVAHTHGKEENQKYHPPSLQDLLVTIQRVANDATFRGISVVVTIEGFYILYPKRDLIKRLHREPGFDTELANTIKKFYPEIFTRAKSGSISPDTLSEALKKHNIVCEFIPRHEPLQ